VVVDGVVLVAWAEVEDAPPAAAEAAPAAEDLAPANDEMKTSSSGAGMSNGSPYISWASITIGCVTPAAIGCAGSTVHTSSRSAALRQRRLQDVPSRRVKIFE
jgi:hypothetical protein